MPGGAISTDHHLATAAGAELLRRGGTAVDAAVAAAAVLAVVAPHSSGVGGDLFALVHRAGRTEVLESVGRAGSGADGGVLRRNGHERVPPTGDWRAVTVPGCVDGWTALHVRYGRLSLRDVLAPAIRHAREGWELYRELRLALDRVGPAVSAAVLGVGGRPGNRALAATLEAVASEGRDAFYQGLAGQAIAEESCGVLTEGDLADVHARWRSPLSRPMWEHVVHVPPPPSQGYLLLAAGWIAERVALPDDEADGRWPHLLAEAVLAASHDRESRLHDGASGDALLDADGLERRLRSVDPDVAAVVSPPPVDGCTTYLCATDAEGTGVSLIQSVASPFGSQLVVPAAGIVLHNRGQAFSLVPGHPAELRPGRRPPHTLSPALVTDRDGRLRGLLGTRGADAQPQVALQLLARILRHGAEPAAASDAPRVLLARRDGAFRTWSGGSRPATLLEHAAPASWVDGLRRRGHDVHVAHPENPAFGSAHVIVAGDGTVRGAADRRTSTAAITGTSG